MNPTVSSSVLTRESSAGVCVIFNTLASPMVGSAKVFLSQHFIEPKLFDFAIHTISVIYSTILDLFNGTVMSNTMETSHDDVIDVEADDTSTYGPAQYLDINYCII